MIYDPDQWGDVERLSFVISVNAFRKHIPDEQLQAAVKAQMVAEGRPVNGRAPADEIGQQPETRRYRPTKSPWPRRSSLLVRAGAARNSKEN
jgi:hypothetical protein